MDVSIIMINYNTYEYTKNAIESILEHTKNIEYEIILIDNLSPDKSGLKLQEYFQEKIIFIQATKNLGTSKAFNLGLKSASGKYVLWLNPDILIKENFIYKLFTHMEKTPNCGICGGNLLDFHGNPMHSYRLKIPSISTVKSDYSIIKKLYRNVFKKRFYDQYNFTKKIKDVGYITGADMMIRSSIFHDVGAFNENIFMYGEESEFTYRVLTKTKYKVQNIPNAIMYHLEGASFDRKENSFNERRFRTYLDGNLVYFESCYGESSKRKYLKILQSGLKKNILFYKIFKKKDKYNEFLNERMIVLEYLKKI